MSCAWLVVNVVRAGAQGLMWGRVAPSCGCSHALLWALLEESDLPFCGFVKAIARISLRWKMNYILNVVAMAHIVFLSLTQAAPLCFHAPLSACTFQISINNSLFHKAVVSSFIQFVFFIVCHCFSVNLWALPHTTMDLSSITIATTTPVLFCLLLFVFVLTFHLDIVHMDQRHWGWWWSSYWFIYSGSFMLWFVCFFGHFLYIYMHSVILCCDLKIFCWVFVFCHQTVHTETRGSALQCNTAGESFETIECLKCCPCVCVC